MVDNGTLKLEYELEVKRLEVEISEKELEITKNKEEITKTIGRTEEKIPINQYKGIEKEYNEIFKELKNLPLDEEIKRDVEEGIDIEFNYPEDLILYSLLIVGILTYKENRLKKEIHELEELKEDLNKKIDEL